MEPALGRKDNDLRGRPLVLGTSFWAPARASQAVIECAQMEGETGADHPVLTVGLAARKPGDRDPWGEPEIEPRPRLDEGGRVVVGLRQDARTVMALDRQRHVAAARDHFGGEGGPAQPDAQPGHPAAT